MIIDSLDLLDKNSPCEMLHKKMVVYKILHLDSGRIYIGKTTRELWIRIKEHVKKQPPRTFIESAINKYGLAAFDVSIVEECANEAELNEREKFWIRCFNCKYPEGFNFTDGGDGGSGHIVTPETRQKISKTKTGKPGHPNSEKKIQEFIQMNKSRKGIPRKPLTPEHRKKISDSEKGRIVSAETCAKLVASNKNRRAVRCLETGEIFQSITAAAKWAGVCDGPIIAACKKPSRTGGGYHWEYMN